MIELMGFMMLADIGGWLGPKVIGFLGIVVAFGLAILVHEFGHFITAKLFKVPVERFVIGFDNAVMPLMPKCIWEKKIGETTYGLSLMPLGGYVQMKGVVHPEIQKYIDGEDAPKSDDLVETDAAGLEIATHSSEAKNDNLVNQALADQAALYRKPYWQKLIIYSAGVIMNLILACVVVAIIGIKGEEVDKPLPAVVGWQAPASWIVSQDIQQGDKILSVNGTPVETDEDYLKALREALPEDEDAKEAEIVLSLNRSGETIERDLTLPIGEAAPQEPISELVQLTSRPAYVEYVIINAPADKAGLKHGDIIAGIDGEPIDDWNEMVDIIRGNPDKEMAFTILRDGKEFGVTIAPQESARREGTGEIGIFPGTPEKVIVKLGVVEAIVSSPIVVANNTLMYAQNLKKIGSWIVRGQVNKVRQELGGPVAIAQMAGRHAQLGLDRFLQFMIMLNIALAVMNLLPIPVLDGGHICLATYEAIFRKPVPAKVLVPVLQGAVFLILAFVVLVTFSDLFKMFS
ncbi:RIP metalloprotease RseP [bacterium]|nr:RIP metalloprotease RseP [bacterium]